MITVNTLPQITGLLQALTMSGTTAQRPKTFLWVGRFYFDTTLDKPVWVKDPVARPAVWVDSTGATV